MTTKKKQLPQQFDQMFEGEAKFVIKNGDRFTQTCCDCGSSHDIILNVMNDHYEIQVELIKNIVVTQAARMDGCNGVLLSTPVFCGLVDMLTAIAKGEKISKASAGALLREHINFTRTVKIGVAI